MDDRGQFAQAHARRHSHTDFTDHFACMARDDGRPEDFIAALLDVDFHEPVFFTVQNSAVQLLELAHISVRLQAAFAGLTPATIRPHPSETVGYSEPVV